MDHIDRMIEAWARTAPELSVSPLPVAGRLLRAAALLQRRIEEGLRLLGLTYADFEVLNTLRRLSEPGGTKPSVLAASELITSGAMTARLDRLESAGLIERTADRADRRSVRIQLTGAGTKLAVRALDAVIEADETFLEPLDDADRKAVADRLKRILLRAEDA